MNHPTVVLTEGDKAILESYRAVADGMGELFGESCEVVLHSLENLDSSVIHIVNGKHSGRSVGSPPTDVALSMLGRFFEEEKAGNPAYVTYFSKNQRGEPVKSTICLIRGEERRAIGLFCVNFFLATPFAAFLSDFVPPPAGAEGLSEIFVDNAQDLILNALDAAKKSVYADRSVSASNKNKEIIGLLFHKGIFNLKDAVITVAERLGISKNTVYMHIRNLNHDR